VAILMSTVLKATRVCDLALCVGVCRGVQITFHQSLLNRNVTAITANFLSGREIKVIQASIPFISFHRESAK